MERGLRLWKEDVDRARVKARKVTTSKKSEIVEIPIDYSTWIFVQAVLFLLWEGWKLKFTEEESVTPGKKKLRITQKYPTAGEPSPHTVIRTGPLVVAQL